MMILIVVIIAVLVVVGLVFSFGGKKQKSAGLGNPDAGNQPRPS